MNTSPSLDANAERLAQWAQDMHEYDPSKTIGEWLEWAKAQIVGEKPPFQITGP